MQCFCARYLAAGGKPSAELSASMSDIATEAKSGPYPDVEAAAPLNAALMADGAANDWIPFKVV